MFSCTTWLAPRSTLFPYTTLFRSLGPGRLGDLAGLQRDQDGLDHRFRIGAAGRALVGIGILALGQRVRITEAIGISAIAAINRKSTRLNSSHSSISYAVFCLKKKT